MDGNNKRQLKNVPKRHHYIPQFYLAGFTKDGTAESRLWVLDQNTGKQFDAKPKNVAFQKDLYTVNIEDDPGDAFEKAFSRVETRAALIIREIISSLKMPSGEDFLWLMNFIALLAERTPVRRDVFTKPMADVMKMSLMLQFQYPERYEALKAKLRSDGVNFNETVSYEELRDFIYREEYTISFDNNTHLSNLMTALDVIIPTLMERNWSVVYSPPELGDFICSDNPVSLHWTEKIDIDRLGIFNSPGHGLKNTEVSLPLNCRVALLGRFEKVHPASGIIPSRKYLASINSFTCMSSKLHIYSRKKDFFWYNKNRKICNAVDLINTLKRERTKTKGDKAKL